MGALFAPTVVINNVSVGIKPNSFSYKEGFGERNVRVSSAGGGQTSQIISENIETQIGSCKFTLFSTVENVNLIRKWLANRDANAIEVVEGDFTRTFQKAIITNDPDTSLGVDGEVEIEFMSRPAV